MSGFEPVVIKVGVAASRVIFTSWLRRKTPSALPDESLADLLRRRMPGIIEQRKMQRQMDQVADQVGEQLYAFLRHELPKVPENEIAAAGDLVSDVMQSVATDVDFLMSVDLDAVKVERHLLESGAKLISASGLGESGMFVFRRVLRETAAYIADITTLRPDFSARAYKEILRRETAISSMVEEVLARLPSSSGQKSEDTLFETEYRRDIARKLDRLELFGATLDEFSRRYMLSVAYITLSVSSPATEATATPGQKTPATDGTSSANVQRVDRVLGLAKQRILITGEAGSGKTTLLQWLAVMAARREFAEGLESWNERVPIYLPLRRFAASTFPAPEHFLDLSLRNLAGAMPPAWMHHLLESGRALLLLDGVDEMPGLRRKEFADWLTDLADKFPNLTVVVTSRSAAVHPSWVGRLGRVVAFDLQPMSLRDIKSLVDHWHLAVERGIEDYEERQLLARYRENLKAIVEERRPLRALATNPLMCALICALHRDRRAQLPRDRMELYRIALEMLLERRDRERNVPHIGAIDLSYQEKEALIEDLAYWLIRNGQSDATYRQASLRVGKMLPRLARDKEKPRRVLEQLVERSGVLRSPIEGRVDFLHRSFQEYLAAKAVVEGVELPLLFRNALDDQWREVIILAAGHARPAEREELIRGLLERGQADPANRYRLYLIAVACLETAKQISPRLRSEVQAALSHVVPPKTREAATAIAAAKDLAIPYLSGHGAADPETVASCVRALALVGEHDAMMAIREYSADQRIRVAEEVVRSWSQFPPGDYAREVLADAPLVGGSVLLTDSSYVQYLEILREVRHVRVGRLAPSERTRLGRIPQLRQMELSDLHADDFSWITNDKLETLVIRNSSIDSWHGLDRVSNLRSLWLQNCKTPRLDSLGSLARLEDLKLCEVGISSLGLLGEGLTALTRLSIEECLNLVSLRGLQTLTELRELELHDNVGLVSLDEVRGLSKLERISLRGPYIKGFRPLETLPRLHTVVLGRDQVASVAALAKLHGWRVACFDETEEEETEFA